MISLMAKEWFNLAGGTVVEVFLPTFIFKVGDMVYIDGGMHEILGVVSVHPKSGAAMPDRNTITLTVKKLS